MPVFILAAVLFLIPLPTYATPGASCASDFECSSNETCASNGLCAVNAVGTNPGSQPVGTNPSVNTTLLNPLQGNCSGNDDCLMNFLMRILDFIILIGTVVVILMLVFVGYLFVAAQGKEEKIRDARNALLWTVIGALILLGSKAIAEGIKATVQAISVGN